MKKQILTVALALSVAIAGCGSSGPSLSAFKRGFSAQKAQFTQLGRDLQVAFATARGKSNGQIGAEFSSLAQRTSQQADQLQKLNPPAKYKSQRDQLVSGFRTIAADLETISVSAKAGNVSGASKARNKLLQDAAGVRSVDRALTASLGLPQTS